MKTLHSQCHLNYVHLLCFHKIYQNSSIRNSAWSGTTLYVIPLRTTRWKSDFSLLLVLVRQDELYFFKSNFLLISFYCDWDLSSSNSHNSCTVYHLQKILSESRAIKLCCQEDTRVKFRSQNKKQSWEMGLTLKIRMHFSQLKIFIFQTGEYVCKTTSKTDLYSQVILIIVDQDLLLMLSHLLRG